MQGSPATIKLSGSAGFTCNHQAFRQCGVRLQPSGFPAMRGSPATIRLSGSAGFACNHQAFRQCGVRLQPSGFPAVQGSPATIRLSGRAGVHLQPSNFPARQVQKQEEAAGKPAASLCFCRFSIKRWKSPSRLILNNSCASSGRFLPQP
jgi:hypothetical protein